jgi:starch synthase
MTIHNMGYLGRYPAAVAEWLSLGRTATDRLMRPDGIEFHGDVSLLKAGLVYADAITAVSPSYAREIQTPEFGFGLDGLMRHRAGSLQGILNGCDYHVWNPATDPHIPAAFDIDDMAGKSRAREELLTRLAIGARDTPIVGVLGRLAHQKGIDLLVEAAPRIIASAALAIVGSGEAPLESSLGALRAGRPDRVGLHLGYSDPLAHLLVAGADLVVLPSRYEPCGLVQMNAMRYGTLPVVHPVGGLADTVIDETAAPGRGTGFHLAELSASGLARAVARALTMRATERPRYEEMMRRAMRQDFSWARAADAYLALYRRLLT